jgi:hypothetical protein
VRPTILSTHLDGSEAQSLWELTVHSGEPIRLRLLDEGTRAPTTARQLSERSEPTLIATVGLDIIKRAEAARLLAGRLRQLGTIPDSLAQRPGSSSTQVLPLGSLDDRLRMAEASQADPDLMQHQADVILLALQLADKPDPAMHASANMIAAALERNGLGLEWFKLLLEATPRMEPRVAEEILADLPVGKIDDRLMQGIATLADRLRPDKVANLLVDTLSRASFSDAPSLKSELALILAKVEAAHAASILLDALKRIRDVDARTEVVAELMTVADRMDRREATKVRRQAFEVIVAALAKEPDTSRGLVRETLVPFAE